MAIREGRWDCGQCGTRKVRGRDMNCPGCGVKRAENTKFYLAEGEPEVTDAKLIEKAKKGADWYCEHCQSGNRADENHCSQCGATRGSSKSAPVREYALGNIPNGEVKKPIAVASASSPAPTPVTTPVPNEPYDCLDDSTNPYDDGNGPDPRWIIGVIAALVIGIIAFVLWPRQITLKVTGFSWHREVSVSRYTTVVEENWDVPSGGRVLSRRREIRSYVSVLDHYETRTRQVSEEVQVGTESYVSGSRDLGNGFFEDVYSERPVYETRYHTETYEEPVYRQDPVYDTKYRYEIDRWINVRVEKSTGNSQNEPAPFWPGFKLAGDGSARVGNERESGRTETYLVHFLSQGKKNEKYDLTVDRSTWDSYKNNGLYTAKVNLLGKLSDIKPLKNEERNKK